MKVVKKIFIPLLFLIAFNPKMVYAEEKADTVNVTVPSSINVVFNADGSNTISEFGITNNSLLPLTINNIGVTAKNNWNLVSSGSSILKNKRLFNLKMNGIDLVKGNNPMSIPITEGTKKVIPVNINRGAWTSTIKESAFELQVDYSFGTKNFTLNFNSNGGNSVKPITAINGSSVTLPSATRTGYTFKGWKDSKNNIYQAGSQYTMPVGGETLTAEWSVNTYTYNIEYYSSSGKALGSSKVSGTFGSTKSVSAPAKTGYTTPDVQSVVFDSVSTKTIKFTYQPINYSISYNLNGGNVSGNPTSYNIESSAITLKVPSKTGYSFTGWTGSNGTTPQNSITIPSGSTGDKSYTANWKVNNYTVSFNPNGGIVAINTPLTLSEFIGVSASGGTLTATTNATLNTDPVTATLNSPFENGVKYELTLSPGPRVNFTRQGSPTINGIIVDGTWSGNKFTFTYNSAKYGASSSIKLLGNSLNISWDYLDYGSTVLEVSVIKYGSSYSKSYTYGSKIGTLPSANRNGYIFNGWFTSASGGTKVTTTTTIPANNVTYYAQWTPIDYSISYNLNGGSVSGNPTSYNISTATFILKNPTRTGYTFTGWTGSNGSVAQTSVSISSGSTGNKSYTANWSVNTYTLTFDPNGAFVNPSSKKVQYGQSYGTLPTPSKAGYIFQGWYTSKAGGTKVDANTKMGASNTTIYAHWQQDLDAYNIKNNDENVNENKDLEE